MAITVKIDCPWRSRKKSDALERLSELEKAGLARAGKGKISARFWSAERVKDKNGDALRSLLQERGEEAR